MIGNVYLFFTFYNKIIKNYINFIFFLGPTIIKL